MSCWALETLASLRLEGWEGGPVSREAQGLWLGSARLAGTGSTLGLLGSQGFPVPLLPKVSRIALGLFLVPMVTLITVMMWGPGHAIVPSGPSKALSQGLSPQGAVVPDTGGTGQTAMGHLGQCIFYSLLMYNEGPG